MERNISIIWDFDKTLTPDCSTTKTVNILTKRLGPSPKVFWDNIKALRGDKKKPKWKHILASDAPIWMYSLSMIATNQNLLLNKSFFNRAVVEYISLYSGVEVFLKKLKDLKNLKRFKKEKLNISHFIVSAGLKDLIEQCFKPSLIDMTFGCRYATDVEVSGDKKIFNNIPVFCMDETMKTRSIFEISKGSFKDPSKSVNARVDKQKMWSPFENMIYVGDGPTDIPALSLIRDRGGVGVAVYNKSDSNEDIKKNLKDLSSGRRADLITPADYSLNGELYKFIESRCFQILQRYEAENINRLVR
ncbi:MAG: hypothetical protein HAW60_05845 [Bdellovibrionales bacterium]|nr:hypothetical protein [Bdellovibrionales bacterium]